MSRLFFLSPAPRESRGASLWALSLNQGSKSIFTRLLDSGFPQEQKSDCPKAWRVQSDRESRPLRTRKGLSLSPNKVVPSQP